MKRKVVVIEGPLFKKTKQNSQLFLLEIAKRNIEQGLYKPKISS